MTPTIKDVAREASVSICTVSRILNGKKGAFPFSKETRERVNNAARRLNYVPSQVGRAMRMGKTFSVALVTDIEDPMKSIFDAQVFFGLNETLLEAGYHPVPINYSKDPDKDFSDFKKRFDGAIIIDEKAANMAFVLRQGGVPAVEMNTMSDADFDSVAPDDFAGGRMLGESLAGKGYRELCFIGAPTELEYSRRRLAGISSAIEGSEIRLQVMDNASPETFLEMLRKKNTKLKKTVFLDQGGHRMVLALYYLALALGLKVPDDVGLASCHVNRIDFHLGEKVLSGVTYDTAKMASTAANMLLVKMDESNKSEHAVKIPFRLIKGETTA